MKILVITPHLDDAIIGAGGTLLKCIKNKDEVVVIELFDCIETNEVYKKIEKTGFKILKLRNIELNYQSIIKLMDNIRQINPDRILIGIGASHLEHLKAYEIGLRAVQLINGSIKSSAKDVKKIQSVYVFENLEAFEMGCKPNEIFVDISNEFKEKIKILEYFREVNKFAKDLDEKVGYLNKLRGWQSKTKFSELFLNIPVNSAHDIFSSFGSTLVLDEEAKAYKSLP